MVARVLEVSFKLLETTLLNKLYCAIILFLFSSFTREHLSYVPNTAILVYRSVGFQILWSWSTIYWCRGMIVDGRTLAVYYHAMFVCVVDISSQPFLDTSGQSVLLVMNMLFFSLRLLVISFYIFNLFLQM